MASQNLGFFIRLSLSKVAISLKRVKIDEKLLRRAYGNSATRFRTVPISVIFQRINWPN